MERVMMRTPVSALLLAVLFMPFQGRRTRRAGRKSSARKRVRAGTFVPGKQDEEEVS